MNHTFCQEYTEKEREILIVFLEKTQKQNGALII